MARFVFLFIGIILLMTGFLVSQSNMKVKISKKTLSESSSKPYIYAIGGGLSGLGAVFILVGVVGIVKNSGKKKRSLHILQNGVVAEATVTFVDKNYYQQVNHKPIYSIVEYTYQDAGGNTHTRKINNLNSDMVIRKNIQVGSKITIKYLSNNPKESVMLLT